MPRPIAAGVFGMARTTAALCGKAPARNAIVRPAMIETTTVEGDISEATFGMIPAAICGFTAITIASGQVDAGSGLIRTPRAESAATDAAGWGSITTMQAGSTPRPIQPSSNAPPIFPAPMSTKFPVIPSPPSPPRDNLLATIARRARMLFTGGLLAQNWQVVRAIDGEAKLLPVLIDEEQEHEQVSQNDPDDGNHSDIPYLAVVATSHPVGVLV